MKHRPRKRFGQNFLTDSLVVQQIIAAIDPEPGQLILEIGPGRAALSQPLAESGAELHLLEIDRDLAASLRSFFAGREHITVHQGDALEMDYASMTGGRPFRLAGNLPYNISTPLLFHVLRWHDLIIDMHFMLQQEVVQRMAAQPGGKTWGRLSVMCPYRCAVIPLFRVPPASFTPAPRVESTVVRLLPHAKPPVHIDDKKAFERLVSQAFSLRRKKLRNSLRGLLDEKQISALGIDPGARPETLGLEEFAALANHCSHG